MHILNLGAGKLGVDGAFGVDIVASSECDVIANLDTGVLPFTTNSVSTIHAYNILEHINNLIPLMDELHRICKKGAEIYIEVPYYTCVSAFADPTHVRFFTYHTFYFWEQATDHANWFTKARFTITHRKLEFRKLYRLLGIQCIANRHPHLYENYLAYIFPATCLKVTLTV